MKKSKRKDEPVVPSDGEARKPEKIERLWFVQFGTIRRHSRVLYVPLDPTIIRLYHLKKGDILKYELLELRRSPGEDEPLRKLPESESAKDEGEL